MKQKNILAHLARTQNKMQLIVQFARLVMNAQKQMDNYCKYSMLLIWLNLGFYVLLGPNEGFTELSTEML